MTDIVDEVDAAIHSRLTAFTAYAIWGDEESCVAYVFTNDNLDTGYPGEWAEWTVKFLARNARSALDLALEHTGVTRRTWGGVVSVYCNGYPVTEES